MSAGRRYRRAATSYKIAAAYADAWTQPAHYMTSDGESEYWKRGDVLFVVPAIPDGAHPEVANAIERRRRATLEGRCDCGAHLIWVGPKHQGVTQSALIHEDDCPAADTNLQRIIDAHPSPQ